MLTTGIGSTTVYGAQRFAISNPHRSARAPASESSRTTSTTLTRPVEKPSAGFFFSVSRLRARWPNTPVRVVSAAVLANTIALAGDPARPKVECRHLEVAGDDTLLILTSPGDLYRARLDGSTTLLARDVAGFSVNPFSPRQVLVRQREDAAASVGKGVFWVKDLSSGDDDPGERVEWGEGPWRLPFWYSSDRWGAVQFPPPSLLDRFGEELMAQPETPQSMLQRVIISNRKANGKEWWPTASSAFLMDAPCFVDEGNAWVLTGMFDIETDVGMLRGQAPTPLCPLCPSPSFGGFLCGRGDRVTARVEVDGVSTVMPTMSRSRAFGPLVNRYVALTYQERNAVAFVRDRELDGVDATQLALFDATNGEVTHPSFWRKHALEIGLIVAIDRTSEKLRLLAYRRVDGALMYIDENQSFLIQVAKANLGEKDQDHQPIYGFGPCSGCSEKAIAGRTAVFTDGDEIVIYDLGVRRKSATVRFRRRLRATRESRSRLNPQEFE